MGEFRAEGGGDGVFCLVVEDEVAVDFVGDEGEVVALAEVGELGEFLVGEDAADGVVWAAEDEDFCVGLDLLLHGLEVECPLIVWVEAEGDFDEFAAGVVGGGDEGGVDGGGGHDGVAGLGECVAAEVDGGDEAGEEVEPVGLGGVVVLSLEVVEDGVDGFLVGDGVAVDAVIEACL